MNNTVFPLKNQKDTHKPKRSKCIYICFTFIFLVNTQCLKAQNYIDTLYQTLTSSDIIYGSAIDFAGNIRDLSLDICYPVNETPPPLGRPTMVIIHGGAFLAGSKDETSIKRMQQDFAKRGYTSVAVNYRLGMFHTQNNVNCNVSNFGLEWNCLNMQDTSEWYRAFFRGVQDVHGAIRFLVNNADSFNINTSNIFVVGESAGGFIALGVGYMDQQAEVNTQHSGVLPDAMPPNGLYESKCIQGYGLDTSIASMKLSRPDLGSYEGYIELPAQAAYTIQGVGNFFGASFNNIFYSNSTSIPALYTYHQPNDLIVPFSAARVFAGYAQCATQFPFGCQYIVNRPIIFGSKSITDSLESMESRQISIPEYQFDKTNNTADCAMQAANPGLQGHGYDNFWLRTNNMAVFFEGAIDKGKLGSIRSIGQSPLSLAPNPIKIGSKLLLKSNFTRGSKVRILTSQGTVIYEAEISETSQTVAINTEAFSTTPGLFFIHVNNQVLKLIMY